MQINIKNISKSFSIDNGEKRIIFSDLSLSLDKPEFVTIIGPNGCGKSTLLNLIAGFEQPDSGTIELSEHGLQKKIGYVFQDYRASLLPWLNVYRNIEFPLTLHGLDKLTRRKMVNALLEEVNISFSSAQKVNKLSGGQQQLVCLLRSIIANPSLLLCDEPFSALDQSTRWTMAFYLEEFWRKMRIPVIFVSHDIDESILLGDKIILLNRSGSIGSILHNHLPRPRTIDMLSAPEHIALRKQVIEFMKDNGAIRDRTLSPAATLS
jgi:NitT/TauT family transport system ATP-binding protein